MANFADWGLCVKYVKRKVSKVRTAVNDLSRYKTVANRAPKKDQERCSPLGRGVFGDLALVFRLEFDGSGQNTRAKRQSLSARRFALYKK